MVLLASARLAIKGEKGRGENSNALFTLLMESSRCGLAAQG